MKRLLWVIAAFPLLAAGCAGTPVKAVPRVHKEAPAVVRPAPRVTKPVAAKTKGTVKTPATTKTTSKK